MTATTSGAGAARGRELLTVRYLPCSTAARQMLTAHLEAHDHLAIATDLPDGSVEVSGPSARADEITAVLAEIARAVRLVPVG